MFESAELGHSLLKRDYDRALPELRKGLLDAQFDLLQTARFPVILLIHGMDGAGKGETLNVIHEWMDSRHILTHAWGNRTDDERQYPQMWRFWRGLPPKGKMGVFMGSWYTAPLMARLNGGIKRAELESQLEQIVRFEKMLADEGALVLKFWFHLSKKKQKERFKCLEKDPATRWRVTKKDWEHHRQYDQFHKLAANALRTTSTAAAPWLVIEGTDRYYRNLAVGKIILDSLQRRLAEQPIAQQLPPVPEIPELDSRSALKALDLSLSLGKRRYGTELEKYQGRLNLLTRHPDFSKFSLVSVFEGPDAAGKGGVIRRITAALDARLYQVTPIAAPTDEELARPYLWRFWRNIPRLGRVTLFDRSWYGRVLVERVEGFASEYDWMRAYGEINDFEEQLVESGAIITKFWLQISQKEQLKRFKERQQTGYKKYKMTGEDWRNREKWRKYEDAVGDMVNRTSTEIAPWSLIEAEDKYYARIKILRELCERIEAALS